jgi:hypothetical protein
MFSRLYICDRKACGERCSEECQRTTDPGHAVAEEVFIFGEDVPLQHLFHLPLEEEE